VPGRRGVLLSQLLGQTLVVKTGDGDDHAAARRYQPRVSRGNRPGGVGVQEVQDRAEDHAHGPVRIDDGPQLRVRQHGYGLAQVRGHGGHPVAGGQQCPGMGQHDRINVDVGDPGQWHHHACGLVDRGGGGKPGAQVDELADTLPGGPADRLDHECPVP